MAQANKMTACSGGITKTPLLTCQRFWGTNTSCSEGITNTLPTYSRNPLFELNKRQIELLKKVPQSQNY